MKLQHTSWQSNQPETLPDFIIGGAMKSGTTTLHAILDQHPKIRMAHDELGFFDMDCLMQHADFNFFDKKDKQWVSQDIKTNPSLYWDWYRSKFTSENGVLQGEDSTTYLSSRLAAQRIASQKKPIKMIFVLRHPTKRTVSNYLHGLKSGRALYSLEDTLRYEPFSVINRSLYKDHLEAYYHYMRADRIKIILFEDLVGDPQNCIKDLCQFLDIAFEAFDASVFETHSNPTKLPKHLGLQLRRNRLLRYFGDYRYSHFLPLQPSNQKPKPLSHKLIDKLHKRINPHHEAYKLKPNPSTVALLDDFFKTQLEGIDELTGMDLYSKWFK